MAEQTGIAWCDHTMNFWYGCTKVSGACDFCYAEELMDHRYHRVEWGGERKRTSVSNWQQPFRWNRAAERDGVRRKVFALSLGDFFDNQVAESWRYEAWGVIHACKNLDWLILTKRPQNIPKMLPDGIAPWSDGPWPHVWLGTTAENQEEADRRIPHLLAIPAAVRFLSVEPMLGPVDLTAHFLNPFGFVETPRWIICGGESGKHARPFNLNWARSIREQSKAAGVAFFVKQMGDNPVGMNPTKHHGADPGEWPADLRIREFPDARPADPA